MKKKITAVLASLFLIATNLRADSFFNTLGKREAGDLGPIFWIPVCAGLLLGVIIVVSTTGKNYSEPGKH